MSLLDTMNCLVSSQVMSEEEYEAQLPPVMGASVSGHMSAEEYLLQLQEPLAVY